MMTRDEARNLLDDYIDARDDLYDGDCDGDTVKAARIAVLDAMAGAVQWRPPETAPQGESVWLAYRDIDHKTQVTRGWRSTRVWYDEISKHDVWDDDALGWLPIDPPPPPAARVREERT